MNSVSLHKTMLALACLVCCLVLLTDDGFAAEQKQQSQKPAMPPALVVTAPAVAGSIAPQTEYIGTVYFPEVADVASEVVGRVDKIEFEEGQRVRKGNPLVVLSKDLVKKELDSAEASYKAVLSTLGNARNDLQRTEKLFKSKSVTAQDYDEDRFLVEKLEFEAMSLKHSSERLALRLAKGTTYAPFDGVVLEKKVARGEWLQIGSVICVLARDDVVDVLVDVQQSLLQYLKPGSRVPLKVAGREMEGELIAVIPDGDQATRTFPVKIRVLNPGNLAQGMEAKARIPAGIAQESVMVPRDAVLLTPQGQVVWVVTDGTALAVPVKILAFVEHQAAVQSLNPGFVFKPGDDVVTKGNERLRPGQPVMDAAAAASPKQ